MEMDKPAPEQSAHTTDRIFILGLILFGWALIIVLRLFDLQIFSHAHYLKLAESQQDRLRSVEARRGSIQDRNGNYLAISSDSQFVVVNPRRIPSKEMAAALLGRILDIDPAKLQADLEAAAASKHHHGYFVVDPHVSDEKAETLKAMKLDWLEIRAGSLRSYPNGQLASHVIGNVGGGEGHGAAGIELKLDKELAGSPGLVRTKVDVKQRAYDAEVVKAPVPGKNIGLTIDSELQHVAEDSLKTAVITNHADHGSLVAMDPYTGEIRALANYPTYDANERLHAGEEPHGREDLAVVAPFEPGSVFKVVTLSAAMETTNLKPSTMINCGGGVMTLFTRVIHDSHPYGALTVEDVLAKSSNIGAIRIGMQVGNKNLYEYIRKFGFGRRTGIELPAEAPGMLRPLKRWQPTSIGSVPMGHEISVTSIQLVRLGAVIANGGYLVQPHLVKWKQADGEKREFTKTPPPVKVLEPQTVATLRNMMHRVTMKGGTAQRLQVPGYTFAGKTGTAQIYDYAHHVYTHKYNASFLGFAPLNDPRLVVIVTISGTTGTAGFGGAAAGPVFETEMATALRKIGVPRDIPEDIEELLAKERKASNEKPIIETDMADLSTPFTEEEIKQANGDALADGAVILAEADPNAPKVPNFVGKTVRDVMQEAASTGLDVNLFGDGLARAQTPPAGALLLPGAHIYVRFDH
jgi:cell division protein FtsI (penicillin-binding protein 3)